MLKYPGTVEDDFQHRDCPRVSPQSKAWYESEYGKPVGQLELLPQMAQGKGAVQPAVAQAMVARSGAPCSSLRANFFELV